jgi:hypothetical protein
MTSKVRNFKNIWETIEGIGCGVFEGKKITEFFKGNRGNS